MMSLASFLKGIAFHRSSDSGIVLLPAPSHPCGHWFLPVSYPHTAAGPLPVLTGFSRKSRHPPRIPAFQGMENVNAPNIALLRYLLRLCAQKNQIVPCLFILFKRFCRIKDKSSNKCTQKNILYFYKKATETSVFSLYL